MNVVVHSLPQSILRQYARGAENWFDISDMQVLGVSLMEIMNTVYGALAALMKCVCVCVQSVRYTRRLFSVYCLDLMPLFSAIRRMFKSGFLIFQNFARATRM